MSVEDLKALRARAGVPDEEIAKLIGVKPDQLERLLTGELTFRRLHAHGLDKASLSLAFEKRDLSLLTPRLRGQIDRVVRMFGRQLGVEPRRSYAGEDDLDWDLG